MSKHHIIEPTTPDIDPHEVTPHTTLRQPNPPPHIHSPDPHEDAHSIDPPPPTTKPPTTDPEPTQKPPRQIPTPKVIATMIAQAAETNDRDAAILELTWYLGLRPKEVADLTTTSVRQVGQIAVLRAKKRHQIIQILPTPLPLFLNLQYYVARQINANITTGNEPLFVGQGRRTRISERSINAVVRKHAAPIGLSSYSPRNARHSAATKVASVASARTAQILLGHESLETTQAYLDCSLPALQEALLVAYHIIPISQAHRL